MSFTYIARKTHENYMANRQAQGLGVFYYKLASTNPRNPINQANDIEAKLLAEFNAGRTTPHSEIITAQDGQTSLYFATPVAANKASCMRCHSAPQLAPASLIVEYCDKAGFGEQVGQIRAIISLTYPLEAALIESRHQWLLLSGIAFLVFLTFYAVVAYFLSRINKQHLIIQLQAQTDSLTGLFNRRHMTQNISDAMANNAPCSIILIDIDHFKQINDTYGHTIGDQVLKALATQLLHLPSPIQAYRFGGEEFLLLLAHSNAQDSAKYAEQLRQQVEQTAFNVVGQLTISLGIATQTADDTTQTLLTRADDMLYLAKQHGRNRIETDQAQ
jgi:diguanylate cyclase (GGDEF)-like protein